MTKVKLNRRDGGEEIFSIDEFTRWMCLMEAFHFLETKADELKIDLFSMMKPAAIEEYIHGDVNKKIDGRFNSMKPDLVYELKHGML